jgi:hypothetical protein
MYQVLLEATGSIGREEMRPSYEKEREIVVVKE